MTAGIDSVFLQVRRAAGLFVFPFFRCAALIAQVDVQDMFGFT